MLQNIFYTRHVLNSIFDINIIKIYVVYAAGESVFKSAIHSHAEDIYMLERKVSFLMLQSEVRLQQPHIYM